MSRENSPSAHRSWLARANRVLAIPVILLWIVLAVIVSVFVPTIEHANEEHAGGLVPHDSPSSQAAIRMGKTFLESNASSAMVIVFEAHGRTFGSDQDHRYYDELVRRLRSDKEHVQSVQALWGDPVTRAGQQSADAQAAMLSVRTSGDTAQAVANKSLKAVRQTIKDLPAPPGVEVHVGGASALASDTLSAADASMGKLTLVTVVLIIAMLLIFYPSITTTLMPLLVVLIELAVARGVVSVLVESGLLGISSFAMNMLVALVLGVGTDYSIFLLGRYHEAREDGEDKETAYYTASANVTHVILGSGAAISGASICLSFTYLDYFKTLGPACAVGMVLAALGGLTLGPAFLVVGTKLGLLEPKSSKKSGARTNKWRRLGTTMVRWPVPLIVIGVVIALACSGGWAIYQVSYNNRDYVPATTDSSQAYAAAYRHFQPSELSSDVLYVESDHDMRNTSDMISLDRIAKAILRTTGVSLVTGVTRPNGRPLEHASLPYSMGQMGVKVGENISFLLDRAADIGQMADAMTRMIVATDTMRDLTTQLSHATHLARASTEQMWGVMNTVIDDLGYVDDYFRPFRNFFYWETYCYEIPWCWAGRSMFDAIDQFDKMRDSLHDVLDAATQVDQITPQMIVQIQALSDTAKEVLGLVLTMQSTLNATIQQLGVMLPPMIDMAKAFDNSKNDDFFFLTKDTLQTHDFKVGRDFFMTPDGKGARFILYHQGEALSVQGVDHVRKVEFNTKEALKGTALADAKIYMSGSASTYRDIEDF